MADLTDPRPSGVPDAARLDPDAKPGFEWKQCDLDADGKKHGRCLSWTKAGVLHGESMWVHGVLHGPNKNFHPDGTVASIGDWRDGVLHDCHYYRCDTPSNEPWPADAGDAVRSVGYFTRDGKTNHTIRYFDAVGVEIAMTGAPLPTRPPSVPDTARWFPDLKQWVDGEISRSSSKQVGYWRWFTADGELRHDEHRDAAGKCTVVADYQRGNLKTKTTTLPDGGEERDVHFDTGALSLRYRKDAAKRETYKGSWNRDGSLVSERTVVYAPDATDRDDITSVTERGHGGVLAFEARREGAAIACILYDGAGAAEATGTLRGGMLDGTWRALDAGVPRRELEMTGLGVKQRATGEGLRWRLGEAAYRVDRPTLATPDALRGVDAIEWAGLEGAYGSSVGEFPQLLRALVSTDPLVRPYALGKISGEIEHQGSTYPATAAVIPWFAKLLAHAGVDRSALLRQIQFAGEAAFPYIDQVADLAENDPGRIGIVGTVNAVAAAWPQIWALFPTSSADDRQRILVIAKLAPVAAGDLLQLARDDADPDLRACAIDSATSIAGVSFDALLPLLRDDDLLVRAATAIAIGRERGPESPPEVTSVLGEIVRSWPQLAGRWAGLPYTDGHVLAYVAITAGGIRTPAARELAPALRASIDEVDGVSAVSYGQGLLALALGRGERPFATSFVDILDTLARSHKFWVFNVNAHEVLDRWNLPCDRAALEALVARLRAAPDPEVHLRTACGIAEPAAETETDDVADDDEADDGDDDDEATAEAAPAADPHLAALTQIADVVARPDVVAFARAALDATRLENRQAAAQQIQQIADAALKAALAVQPVDTGRATVALELFELARPFDRRAEWSRIWPISDAHAEPAMFALAAGQWDKAEALAREQLRDPRAAMADNHKVQLQIARAARGVAPDPDVPLVDPKYQTRTYNRLYKWLGAQPIEIVDRVLDGVPAEVRLQLLVSKGERDGVIDRVSRPLHRVVDAMHATLDRIADGILPAIVGGATNPISDLIFPDANLRWFLKEPPVPVETDDDRRALGHGWWLYSVMVCASQRFWDPQYVVEALTEARRLGVDENWVDDARAQLDRDVLEAAYRELLVRTLPRIAGAGATAGRAFNQAVETLTERAQIRLLEVTVEVAPQLALAVLAAMPDGRDRLSALPFAHACPELVAAYPALGMLGDGEILKRLTREVTEGADPAAMVVKTRSWLHVLAVRGQRFLPQRFLELGEGLLARPVIVDWLTANDPDHPVVGDYMHRRQPMALLFAALATTAQQKGMIEHVEPLLRLALRFPRGRGSPARALLRLASASDKPTGSISIDEALALTAGPFAMEPEVHELRARILAQLGRRDEVGAELSRALAAGACPVTLARDKAIGWAVSEP